MACRDFVRIVEEQLDPVALEESHGRVEPLHETTDHLVELPKHVHQLLGFDRVDEVRPSTEVGEEHRDQPTMAAQDRVVPRGDDRVASCGERNRRSFRGLFQLQDLGFDPVFERSIQLEQLGGLRRDRVVVALDLRSDRIRASSSS